MDTNHWTDERIDKLRGLFLKKWESLDEDDRAFGDYLIRHHIFVMGLRDVRRAWNMGGRGICIENPTFESRDEVAEILENKWAIDSRASEVRKAACEETWFLIPEEFAKKALVLGLP